MTQKQQADYDKALIDSYNKDSGRYGAECVTETFGVPKMYASGFHSGYMFGVWSQMEHTRKKTKENENAFAFASDNISQNAAIHDISSDKSLMRAELAKAAMPALIRELYQIATSKDVAREAVMYADALIKELGKEE